MVLRIAVFGPVTKYGGVYNHTHNLVKWLRKSGLKADYFTEKGLMPKTKEIEYIRSGDSITSKIRKIRKNIDYANRHYDIAHLQGTYAAFSFLFKIPVVVTIHSTADLRYDSKAHFIRQFVIDNLIVLNLKNANVKVITVSRYVRDLLKRYGIDSDIVPNAISDGMIIKPGKTKREKIMLYVGEFNKHKNIFALLRAYERLQKKYSLLLIGWGVLENELRRFIKKHTLKRAKIIIRPPRKKIIACYRKSFCFVLPSERETFGIVVLESMANRLPIIVNRGTGAEEIVTDMHDGLIINAKKPEEIVRAVNLLENDKKLYDKISKNQAKTVGKYKWGSVIKKIIRIYESCYPGKRNENHV